MRQKFFIFGLVLLGFVGVVLATAPIWWKIERQKKTEPIGTPSVLNRPLRPLPERENRQEIVFGTSISSSGHFTAESRRMWEGYEMWKDWVNSRGGIRVGDHHYKVRIIYRKDGSNTADVRRNMEWLIEKARVDFLLGPFSSGLTAAASRIAEKHGVIMVEGCGASESIFTSRTRYTFSVITSASWYLKEFFEMASGLEPKPRTFAVLAKNRLFPRSVARGARIWGAKVGMKEVYFRISELRTDDYQDFFDGMRTLHPDLVIFCGHYKDSLDFTEQMNRQQAFTPKAVVMTLGPTQRGYVERFGKRAESMMGVTQWVENSHFRCPVFGNTEIYVKEFMKKFGHRPTYQNAGSSACGVVYQLALERSTRLDAGQVLRHLRTMDVETLYGRVKFNERGINVGKGMAIVQVQDGRSRPIWPKRVALRPPRYPLVHATSR